jgi:AmmeMemoRadiSam system protein A
MPSDTDPGAALLARARAAIAAHLDLDAPLPPEHQRLGERGASFVTLKRDGVLRGCIGSVRARRPLGEDIDDNAVAAASRDPRFAPLTPDEFDEIRIEVSLLSRPDLISTPGESALLDVLRPGRHGVILHGGCRNATFLPQVWEQLPEPRRFLAELKRTAGLPPEHCGDDLLFATFTVDQWSE